jgi:hypothetical protein
MGSPDAQGSGSIIANRISVQEAHAEVLTPESLMHMFEVEFNERLAEPDEKGLSREDQQFLKIVQENVSFEDGHYVIPLPFKDNHPPLQNNRSQAMQRLIWQKKKMHSNPQYHEDYTKFIAQMIDKGYCEIVTDAGSHPGQVRYLPHHRVYHPTKKKLRVVFYCSARFSGVSLNDCLLQGPDLMNTLFGVLTRFRSDPVAFSADLEAMFYQVKVPVQQRPFLRFLWWPEGNTQLTSYVLVLDVRAHL